MNTRRSPSSAMGGGPGGEEEEQAEDKSGRGVGDRARRNGKGPGGTDRDYDPDQQSLAADFATEELIPCVFTYVSIFLHI
ncbi:hypothetical protein CSUI_011553 [Cystoisospora suis]|uniref:Uncharacterized protein n=1 Tax=Cystoisospora suis TaxID=483139 RepID=A0A2C6K8A2_9APIC|nr:hypothetical protein CSUI_011553 [Cystoisospora suis]